MNVHVPDDLQGFVQDLVRSGRYASEDEVIRDALTRLNCDRPETPKAVEGSFIGSMREDAELLGKIAEEAVRNRREQPWRLDPSE